MDYRPIMDGTRRGPVGVLLRGGLSVASLGYRAAVAWRNRHFDTHQDAIVRVDVPVISVGNVTTGGTGKTPLVAFLAEWFRSRGIRVSIVSRGYGRGDADENDEAAELHQRLPDVPHVQDPDRVHAATIAIDELDTQLILMDDGFQHRRLHRDLDIVLIDATCPFGYGHLLPRGLLREPLRNLNRADVLIITRCDHVDESRLAAITETLRKYQPDAPIVRCRYGVTGLREFDGRLEPAESLRGAKVALVCGIGNPQAFRTTVESLGAEVVCERLLPDHAAYDRDTMQELKEWIRQSPPVDLVVCTQKDLVKIRSDRIAGNRIAAVAIDAKIDLGGDLEMLLETIAQRVVTQ